MAQFSGLATGSSCGEEGDLRGNPGTSSGSHGCAPRGCGGIILAMQELLSKNPDPHTPLSDQEYYELSLLDEANGLRTRYCVRPVRAVWVEVDGQFMWNQEEVEYFWILSEAKQRYAERRLALAKRGFIYSDMDF